MRESISKVQWRKLEYEIFRIGAKNSKPVIRTTLKFTQLHYMLQSIVYLIHSVVMFHASHNNYDNRINV